MMMKEVIFREYDIRGVPGVDFDLEAVENIGRAVATHIRRLGGRTVAVGRDCRLTSPEVHVALVKGLNRSGADVLDFGLCPTPVVYFGIRHFEADGGVMITASHNSAEYNGFKICVGKDTIFGEKIQELKQMVLEARFDSGSGTVEPRDAVSVYSDFIVNHIDLKKPLRIGVDAGNGTGGVVAGPILKKLGVEVHPLYFDMDGRFPNHTPDPTVSENMEELSRLVVEKGLDLGVGFDGDSDRIGVVDEQGRIIWGDLLLALFAREILKEVPGATIIGDVKCSQVMYDDIQAHGGRAIMWKTGHSLVKDKLREEQAALAGEMSGHIFFAHRFFGFDDAIYAACRLLEIVAGNHKPISSLLADLPSTFNTPEIRIPCAEERKFELVEQVKKALAQNHRVIDVDGVRVVFPDGWGLLRASNTGPILVMRFEAQSQERLREFQDLVEGLLEKFGGGTVERP